MFISVTVCDVCHRVGQPTSPWLLGFQGKTRRVDLCGEHADSLAQLYDIGKSVNDSLPVGGAGPIAEAGSAVAVTQAESRRLRRAAERDDLHAVMRSQRRTGRHGSAPIPVQSPTPAAPKPATAKPATAKPATAKPAAPKLATAKPEPVAPQPEPAAAAPTTPAPALVFASDEFDTPLWRSIIQRH